MQIHNKIATDLSSILGKKFDKLTIANEQAVSTIDPSMGRIFTLDYTSAGQSHGNVTVNIVDPSALVVYYNTNITEDMRYDDKKDWYNFLKELRYFAKRNLMGFDVRNIGKQQLDKQDYAYIKTNDTSYDSNDDVMESKLHGSIKTSYQNIGEVRLVIKHTAPVDEEKRGSRTRQVHSMYIEDSNKERTRIPFNFLSGARAIAQHVNQGGSLEDEMGQHIHEMIQEVVDLKKFVKTFKNANNFADDQAYKIIEQAKERALGLAATLKTLAGPKGYATYVEQYEPTENTIEQADLDDIRAKLVRIEQDNIVDSVLPSLARGIKEMEITENNLAAQLANSGDDIELLPNPEEDQAIKDRVKFIQRMVQSGKKTSENPYDGLLNQIVLTLTKRADDAISNDLAKLDIRNVQDRDIAVKLAAKYLQGKVQITQPKAKKKLKNDESLQLEDWANQIIEGTWAIPDTEEAVNELEKLLQQELPVGADAENASSALYSLIGDDTLFDDLAELAEKDPEADARPVIKDWIKRNIIHYPRMPAELVRRALRIADDIVDEAWIDSDLENELEDDEDYKANLEKEFAELLKAAGIKENDNAELMKKGIEDLKKKIDKPNANEKDIEDLKAMLKKAGLPVTDSYDPELSAMANSSDKVERAYGEILQAQPDESKVGDYISSGMTKDQILKLIDMLEPEGYDKDFLLKDLAPMMETVKEAKADPAIVAKFAKVSPSQRSYYIMKWAEENGIDTDEAMEMAGYEKGSYMGAGAYNWHYVGEGQVDEADIELSPGVSIKTDNPDAYKGTKTTTGYVGGQEGEDIYIVNRVLDRIAAHDPGDESILWYYNSWVSKAKLSDAQAELLKKELIDMGYDEDLFENANIEEADASPEQRLQALYDKRANLLKYIKQNEQGAMSAAHPDDAAYYKMDADRGKKELAEIEKEIKHIEDAMKGADNIRAQVSSASAESVEEAEIEEGSIKYMHSLKDKGMSDEEIAKELGMKPEEVKQAMSKTESVEEDHTQYKDSQKLASQDGVEVFAYDHGADNSAVEVYVDGKEVASGYIDVQAGDIVVDGTSYPDVKAVLDEYLSAFAEQKAFEEKMLKLAGLK